MRLGTCVAAELLVGASLVVSCSFALTLGVREVREQWHREARAAEESHALRAEQFRAAGIGALPSAKVEVAAAFPAPGRPAERPQGILEEAVREPALSPEALATATVPEAPSPAPPGEQIALTPSEPAGTLTQAAELAASGAPIYGVFHSSSDAELIEPLRSGTIKQVRFNRGGSSISLRLKLNNGAMAAFKPEQTALHSIPRKEIAAYRLDRLLGLNAVPPAIGRAFAVEELLGALDDGSAGFLPRLQEEMEVEGGQVTGELSWWIPVIEHAKVDGFEIDTTNGIVTWKRYLTVGTEIPAEQVGMLHQISNMVLFDFLINNPDRWSGSNARTSPDGVKLYFMDNTLSFGPDPEGHRKVRIYVQRSQKFSRTLVEKLRALTEESVRQALEHDTGPYRRLLYENEIQGFMKRREFALAYIDQLIATHGESAVLVFP